MTPSDYLHRYIRVAEVILVLLALCFAAWEVHQFAEHERDIGRKEVQALWDAQTAKDKEAARAAEKQLAIQRREADNHATERDQTIRAAAAAAGNASLGLRDAIAALGRSVPGDPSGAGTEPAATLGKLLADCEGRYRGMAESADRHASDSQKLREAWPSNSANSAAGKVQEGQSK